MNLYTALSLFSIIILVYWIITELFTILFRFTGLPADTGILVMLVEHPGEKTAAPSADTVFTIGDKLTLYGLARVLGVSIEELFRD